MPFYNFKRNCKVYLVTSINGSLQKFQLEVYPDLSFSQTFDEQSQNVKTLHDQDAMFESAVINKANPANFSFTVLLNDAAGHTVLGDHLTFKNSGRDGSVEALYSSDLYIDTGVDIFKLEKCVFERGTYQIQREALVTVSIEGTATKLSKFGLSGTIIPGTLVQTTRYIDAIIPRAVSVVLDGVELPNIAGMTLEYVNEVEWLKNDTLHKSLNITGPSDTMYPEGFVVSSKSVTGTIQQYITDTNDSRMNSWSLNSSLEIKVGDVGAYHFDILMPNVVFTNRVNVDEIFTQVYDFKATSAPSSSFYVPLVFSEYDTYLKFIDGLYIKNGVKQPLSIFPGYAFTRSGQQGAINADGTVSWFAANTPVINANGFHCYGTLTNLLLYSQQLDIASRWTVNSTTVTANAGVAPDGLSTVDKIAESDTTNTFHRIAQSYVALAASTAYTFTIFLKAAERSFARFGCMGGSTTAWASGLAPTADIDLTTGSISNVSAGATASAVALSNGWYRCVITATTSASPVTVSFGLFLLTAAGGSTTYVGTAGSGVFAWQAQLLTGAFPNGGPLIVTTNAAASIGASDLELGASLPNGDFITWLTLNLAASPVSTVYPLSFSTAGSGTGNDRIYVFIASQGYLSLGVTVGGVAQAVPGVLLNVVGATGGRFVFMIRRKNGIYSLAAKRTDGVVSLGPDAGSAGAVPTSANSVEIGALYNGAFQINGQVEGFFQRNGTFTDADIITILTNA